GIDFWGIVIIDIAWYSRASGTRNGCIHGMFIGPCGAASGGVNDSKDRIRSQKIPWINRCTTVRRVSWELRGIDGKEPTVSQTCSGCAAIEQGLTDINPFFVFGSRTVEHTWSTGPMKKPIACVTRWGSQRPVIRQIIERSVCFWCSAGDDVRQSRE